MVKTIGPFLVAAVIAIWTVDALAIETGLDCAEGTEVDQTITITTPVSAKPEPGV